MFEKGKKYWVWFGNEIQILEIVKGSTLGGEAASTFDRFYLVPPKKQGEPATLGQSDTQITIKTGCIIALQEFFL